jgi:hypothetical protein
VVWQGLSVVNVDLLSKFSWLGMKKIMMMNFHA